VITLQQIETEQARVTAMIEQFKQQSVATEYVIDRAVIPLAAGERLAGPIFKDDGSLDYYLIKLPGDGGDLDHGDALEYAVERGGKLPDRHEARLLMANLADEFEKVAHWLEDEYEPNTEYAWYQDFGYGYQGHSRKSAELRAVVVRRFIPSSI